MIISILNKNTKVYFIESKGSTHVGLLKLYAEFELGIAFANTYVSTDTMTSLPFRLFSKMSSVNVFKTIAIKLNSFKFLNGVNETNKQYRLFPGNRNKAN